MTFVQRSIPFDTVYILGSIDPDAAAARRMKNRSLAHTESLCELCNFVFAAFIRLMHIFWKNEGCPREMGIDHSFDNDSGDVAFVDVTDNKAMHVECPTAQLLAVII